MLSYSDSPRKRPPGKNSNPTSSFEKTGEFCSTGRNLRMWHQKGTQQTGCVIKLSRLRMSTIDPMKKFWKWKKKCLRAVSATGNITHSHESLADGLNSLAFPASLLAC